MDWSWPDWNEEEEAAAACVWATRESMRTERVRERVPDSLSSAIHLHGSLVLQKCHQKEKKKVSGWGSN